MTQEMHLLGESIQNVTLVAWPIVYGHENRFDQDSRDVLEVLRNWAEEFENWWLSHDEDWMEENDYIIEIEEFAERKAKKYVLEEFGVDIDEESRRTEKMLENLHRESEEYEREMAEEEGNE